MHTLAQTLNESYQFANRGTAQVAPWVVLDHSLSAQRAVRHRGAQCPGGRLRTAGSSSKLLRR